MLLSTTTYAMVKDDDFFTAVKMIKQAGFDAYDLSLVLMGKEDGDCRFNRDDYRAEAQKLRDFADGLGIVCNQAHAPYPSSFVEEDKTAERFSQIVRSMEIAAICGANYIIVHPCHHLPYRTHREELKEMNVKFYTSLIPYCEKIGIKVAVENMWQREPYMNDPKNGLIVESTCSRAEEFCEYIDALPREYFGACLDIGHTVLTNENLTRMITMLGHDRLKALHAHDNWIISDAHSVPLLGRIPYDEVIAALREIDYTGDLTLETIGFEGPFPFELKPAVLHLLHSVGRYLIKQMSDGR